MKSLHRLLLGVFLVLTLVAGTATADQPEQVTWAEAMAAARVAYLKLPEARTTATSDSLFKPYDSGPLDGQGPATQVVVDVTGLQELRLITKCEKSTANCNIWGEPILVAKDGSVTRLTALTPTAVKVGWGQLLADKNWQNNPLRVGDRTFQFGLWVHADSELCYALDGRTGAGDPQRRTPADRAGPIWSCTCGPSPARRSMSVSPRHITVRRTVRSSWRCRTILISRGEI